jgi:hypothetical protein
MILLELGQALGYFHSEFRLGVCSPFMEQPPLVGNTPASQGAALPNRTPLTLLNCEVQLLTRQGLRPVRRIRRVRTVHNLTRLTGLRPCLVS